ncbi:(R,R)-butanediol dehydrogenase/meso-butanediol dehydrogenase/diacetyl reductase [Sphingobium sp. B1D7B]|uniref:alcohol dehydrogenase catalytic domain-containing protein n=1 Tax=unclassified Sphingobium TaxID=2611147 RepID=UPI0022252B69|nr:MULTISPECIES: alcohol dehydrogenase catalytic domain-containing protein [unclassified Sphingobium]MCW2392755.1 (R,R)-butanediol dehydrogenase/meso-butanediol dehydrogenase/diacetyl reductase [Sphingobium sp. B11D3A]MCW2404489.1 (R,R)-butanediol dehydrogenase/meso-butanediol dehydrogenase/diacetyl reductase [Sphingobium sp. B1D7B]
MKAVIFQALHTPLAFEDVPDPTPGEGELVVKVGRCGICGSDLHMTQDAAYGCKHGDVLGHEFAGEVVALGRNTQGRKVGELVSVIPLKSCGDCEHCRKGEVQWCASFGLQGGGYADYAVTRPNQCVPLPAGLTLADGAIIEPLAVALHGVNLSGLKTGDKVLVLGAGPIGLAVAFWAKRLGAAKVAVQDISTAQQQRAHEMGADVFVVDPQNPVESAVQGLGGMADIVFECVGVPGLIAQAVDQVRPRGTILLLGLCTKPDTFNSFAMLGKEVRLVTSAFFTVQEYEAALAALEQGAIAPRLMVTSTIALADTPTVFEALKQRGEQCKVLIAPDV